MELAQVVLHTLRLHDLIGHDAGRGDADDGAIVRPDVLEQIDQPPSAGARHVLHDDVGPSRNVLADMPRKDARVAIERAARAESDRN